MYKGRHPASHGYLPQPRVRLAIHAHPCASCSAPTPRTWFCAECEDRARAHVEEDPYDDLGGEGEAGA